MRSDDFLPCPFCGTERPAVWKRDDGWAVKCVEGCSIVIEGYISRNGAKKAWNQRADGLEAEIKKLRRAVEFYKIRMDAFQKWQIELPEPHRTHCCDIIANGQPR